MIVTVSQLEKALGLAKTSTDKTVRLGEPFHGLMPMTILSPETGGLHPRKEYAVVLVTENGEAAHQYRRSYESATG